MKKIKISKIKEKNIAEHLRELEAFKTTILDTAPDCMKIVDTSGKLLYVNKAGLKEHGFKTEKEALGENWLASIEKEQRPELLKMFAACVKGKVSRMDVKHIPGLADREWCSLSMAPIKDKQGGVMNILIVSRDITEKKRQEREAMEKEGNYKMLIENIPQKIFLKNKDSIYLSCNNNYARDLKIEVDEIAGKTDYAFFPKQLAKKYRADDQRILKSGKTEELEEEYIENGQKKFVHTVKVPIKDKQKKVSGLLGIFWDVTKQRQVEEEIKFESLLLDNTSDMIAAVEPKTLRIVYANKTAAARHGYTVEELLKLRITDLDTPETARLVPKILGNILTKKVYTYEAIRRRKDGSTFPTEVIAQLITVDGRTLLLGSARDITDRKKIEKELENSEEKYKSLVETSPDCIKLFDLEGKLQFINKGGLDEHGLKNVAEAKKWSALDTVIEEDRKGFEKAFADAKIGKTTTLEVRHTKEGANREACLETVAPVKDAQRKIVGIFGVSRDITKFKKLEAELILSDIMIKNMTEGVYLVGLDDVKIKYTSLRFEKMFGYKPGEMIGRHASIVNAPTKQDPQKIAEEIMSVIRRTGEWHGEVENIKKDGTSFWCYANVSIFVHPKYGKVLMAVHSDITERKRAEEKIEESRKNLQVAQRLAHLGSWQWVIATDTVTWSEELYRINGRDPKLPAPSFKELPAYYTPESWQRLSAAVGKTLKSGESYELELEIVRPDGQKRLTLAKGEANHNGNNKITRLHGTVEDITERKQMEQEMKKRIAELERYQNLIVGRELKMIELKKEIQQLTKKLAEKN